MVKYIKFGLKNHKSFGVNDYTTIDLLHKAINDTTITIDIEMGDKYAKVTYTRPNGYTLIDLLSLYLHQYAYAYKNVTHKDSDKKVYDEIELDFTNVPDIGKHKSHTIHSFDYDVVDHIVTAKITATF